MAHYVGILDGSGENWGVRIPDVLAASGPAIPLTKPSRTPLALSDRLWLTK